MSIKLTQHCAQLMGWRYWEGNNMADLSSVPETSWVIEGGVFYDEVCLVSRPVPKTNGTYAHYFQIWEPTCDYSDAVELRAEIRRRGLEQQFIDALYVECGIADMKAPGWSLIFALACATPEQTAKAFVTAMEQSPSMHIT